MLRTAKGRSVLALVVVMLLAVGAGVYFWARADQLPDGAAFRVGDHEITADQLNSKAETLKALYGVKAPQDPKKMDGFRRAVAKGYALDVVLEDAARARGIQVADKNARDMLTKYISTQFGDGSEARERFLDALGNVGTSERALLAELKRMLAVNQLFQQITTGTTISDDELRHEFEKRKGELGKPERRSISNIVVRTRTEADNAAQKLRAGIPFGELAKKLSLDGQTRGNGGQLGAVSATQLEDGYAKAAFHAAPRAIFGPVQTRHGWNLGQVNQIKPGKPASFPAVQSDLKQELIAEKSLKRWRAWLSRQVRNADIQYGERFQPADPYSLPTQQPGSPGTGPDRPSGN